MKNETETLRVGSVAPPFTLAAANRDRELALADLISHGAVILEFLRGTW
jgi:peroxiredoxin